MLQGVGIINVPANIHTIILSEQYSITASQLIQDLLRAAETTADKALIINSQQLQRLESDHPLLVFCVEDCLPQFQNSALAKITTQIISLNSTLTCPFNKNAQFGNKSSTFYKMKIQFQTITDHDFTQLFQIEQAAHSVPWSFGTLKNNQGDNYLNFKILHQNNIIGFCICQTVLDEATLFNIAIDPQFQGNGFGKALLQHLMCELMAKGITTLWLEVRESNQKARKIV